ncbi:AT hook motif protein [Streptomyces sp. NPDC006430]|uniref:AT hook motif protein n=1 Tax=Streptomyces sp. NPDC006430 TaxID=3154299 RepID=UPI0033B0D844
MSPAGEPETSGQERRRAPGRAPGATPGQERDTRTARQARKQVLLRLDPQVYDALARWAGEELRSANAQIEFLLRRALSEAGRLPGGAAPIPPRGRPRVSPDS